MSKWPLQFMALQFGVDLRGTPGAEQRDQQPEPPNDQDALAIVEEWNRRLEAGVDPQFSPSIGCAIRAKHPYLRLLCLNCRQFGDVDLRKIVRPQTFAITSIYDALVCSSLRCRDGRRPKLIGLSKHQDAPLRRSWEG